MHNAITALCNHPSRTTRTPPTLQVSNFPTSRKADKLASWQVGKHCHLPLHHQPVPAAPLFSLTPPVNHRPPLVSRLNPPPCIPAALAASFSLTPPVNQCPPAPSPLLPPRERSPSYPGVNQPHLCYTTHQRETPALRSPPPDPPHPVITQQPCARRCIVPVHHTTLPPLPTAPTLRISPSP